MDQKKESIFLRVGEGSTEVVLWRGGEEIDRVCIELNRELAERLLPAMDELLSKHGISRDALSDIRVESDLPDGYSSRRIAETVANSWRIGRGAA